MNTHTHKIKRWLKPIFSIGLKRAIDDDDIYDVSNGMKSDQITEAFSKLWQLELKRKNPSIFRVVFKLYGCKMFICGIFYAIGETLAR